MTLPWREWCIDRATLDTEYNGCRCWCTDVLVGLEIEMHQKLDVAETAERCSLWRGAPIARVAMIEEEALNERIVVGCDDVVDSRNRWNREEVRSKRARCVISRNTWNGEEVCVQHDGAVFIKTYDRLATTIFHLMPSIVTETGRATTIDVKGAKETSWCCAWQLGFAIDFDSLLAIERALPALRTAKATTDDCVAVAWQVMVKIALETIDLSVERSGRCTLAMNEFCGSPVLIAQKWTEYLSAFATEEPAEIKACVGRCENE